MVAGDTIPRGSVRVSPIPPRLPGPPPEAAASRPEIWLVEERSGSEAYSHGLRIDTRFAVSNWKRSYPVFSHDGWQDNTWRLHTATEPVGIVYHTTESHLAPFDRHHNGRLRRLGRWLLEYVAKQKAYHFLIDRFGRVYRVVEETDAANHAGHSVWADQAGLYVNLNSSFLGVAFEAQSEPAAALTPAQISAGRQLTELLRSKYGIRPENCLTHAQVSVAPSMRRVGNHLDWGESFPFEDIGLPDNYAQPLAAIHRFGFRYTAEFLEVTGPRFWKGLLLGDELLRQDAAAVGLGPGEYRNQLQGKYRKMVAALPKPGERLVEETDGSEEQDFQGNEHEARRKQ